jgi:DNA-binding NarL/FixJ family response regulator
MSGILIVDGHPILRDAIRRAVESALPQPVVLEAGSLCEACQCGQCPLDLIILDPALPDAFGLAGLQAIRAAFQHVPILVFTAFGRGPAAAEALAQGAAGFVPKSADKPVLLEAIAVVRKGGRYAPSHLAKPANQGKANWERGADTARRVEGLSPSQIRVLQLVRRGLLNKQIAYELGIAHTTVKAHVTAILHKLKLCNRTSLVVATSHLDLEAVLSTKLLHSPAARQQGGASRSSRRCPALLSS